MVTKLSLIIICITNILFAMGKNNDAFLNPPELIVNPSTTENHRPESRKFTGISSLAISPKGRMWAVWYAGITPAEDANNYVVVATSGDNGKTWSPVIPSNIQHPTARFFISRLYSGNLLLIKHGPIDVKTDRTHLMAFISKDDGYSWSKGLLLDERKGISYPDGQQVNDGEIYITYDYNRIGDQNILMTNFTEDDIKISSDNALLKVYNNRKVISKGGVK
jgi:hypothetical protein